MTGNCAAPMACYEDSTSGRSLRLTGHGPPARLMANLPLSARNRETGRLWVVSGSCDFVINCAENHSYQPAHYKRITESNDAPKKRDSITGEEIRQHAQMRPDVRPAFQHEEVGHQEQTSSGQETQHYAKEFLVQQDDCMFNLLLFRFHEFSYR